MTSTSGNRLGVLGGSFDPPHVAHVLLAAYVLLTGEVDEVLVVPVYEHAFGKRLSGFEERVRMCQLAFEGLARVQVSRVEESLPRPNRTLNMLQRLQQDAPHQQLRLVIGSDVLADAAKWQAFDEIARLAPPLVVSRPGYEQAGRVVLPDVSSTEVRELLSHTDAESLARLRALVPSAVLAYARQQRLYP